MSEHLNNEAEPDQSRPARSEDEKARHFGHMLKSMREASKLTTKQLAKRSGLPRAEVVQLEQGEQIPSAKAKQKLEQVFRCTLFLDPHQQVVVQVGDWKEEIDEGIAPLIREMWIAGIETAMSCQQDGWGYVWIQFSDVEHVVRFLNIVGRKFEEGSNSLYNRMNNYRYSNGHIPDWMYEVSVCDFDRIEGMDPPHYPADFTMDFSVRFPPRDLPKVVRRLQKHNQHGGYEYPDDASLLPSFCRSCELA